MENSQNTDGSDVLMSASGIQMCLRKKYDSGGSYSEYTLLDNTVIEFDNVYSYWQRMLYSLASYISKAREDREITLEIMEKKPLYQFFGLAENACDQFMYFLSKDELSGCGKNRNLDQLCYHLLFGPDSEIVFATNEEENQDSKIAFCDKQIKLIQLKRYMESIIYEEHNTFITGAFFDFYISFWSGFEATINQICKVYEIDILKSLEESTVNNMKKLIKRLVNEGSPEKNEEKEMVISYILSSLDDHKEDFLKVFGPYISFPDKYNYLLKHVINGLYLRDRKKDIETLEFGGMMRNTLHNNGVHLKASKSLIISGYEYQLVKNEKRYSNDFADIFLFCQEIFEIYLAIVKGMEELAVSNP